MSDLNDPANWPADPTGDSETRLLWEFVEDAYIYSRLHLRYPDVDFHLQSVKKACERIDIDYMVTLEKWISGSGDSIKAGRKRMCEYLRSEADRLYDMVAAIDYNLEQEQKKLYEARGF